MKNLNVLIIGYYGSNNAGDEILLEATINLLNSVYISPNITAITYSVQNTKEKHNINGISRNKYFQIVKGIKEADIVVGGGGSMLQNVTSNRSLIYYLTILKLAKLMGKKVVLLGNGIGPLESKFATWITMRVLKSLDAIVLRAEDSFNLLKSFNVDNIYLGNDLAFTLELEGEAKKNPKKILINLRKWFYEDEFIHNIVKFIKYLDNSGFDIYLVPFQQGNDDLILKEVQDRLDCQNVYFLDALDHYSLIDEISTAQLFIGMRLHGLVFSSICNTPFIGLSYDPKVSIFAKEQEQVYFDDLNKITYELLVDEFNNVYSNIEDYRSKLERNTEEILGFNHVHKDVLEYIGNQL